MRHIPLLVVLLSSSAALADDIPHPAAIGTGTSNQSIGVAGGAVSVGVESAGSLDTDAGAGGHLTVTVDVLDRKASVGLSSPDAGTDPAAVPEDAADVSSAPTAGDPACAALPGHPLSIAEIGAFRPAGVHVVEVCGGADFGPAGRRAVARNGELSRHIAAHGFSVRELIGLSLSADRTALLVTRAYD